MKLFEITNGYEGEAYVRVVVIAETDVKAMILARDQFKRDAAKLSKPANYYTNLTFNEICSDISKGFVSRVSDTGLEARPLAEQKGKR